MVTNTSYTNKNVHTVSSHITILYDVYARTRHILHMRITNWLKFIKWCFFSIPVSRWKILPIFLKNIS